MRYLVGIGNYQGFDDSIGLRIAETIGERGLDRDFRAIELGGNLLDLVHYLSPENDAVLVVDSARMGYAPGDYRFFTPDEVATRKQAGGLSTHEGDLLNVLELAHAVGQSLGSVSILGIEPAEIKAEQGLSPALARRFDEYLTVAVDFMSTVR